VVYRDEDRGPKTMENHWSTSIYHEGHLYGCSGRHPGGAVLRCINFKSGAVQWDQPKLFRSQQLYVDGHFVVLTEYGHLVLIRANPAKFDPVAIAIPSTGADDDGDGEPDRLLKYPAWAGPVLSHGLLYVRGEGKLVCMELIPAKE
jgi:hypothetical protein